MTSTTTTVNTVQSTTLEGFKASDVKFGKVNDLGKSGKAKIVFLSGPVGPVTLKTPTLYLPFGVHAYEENWEKPTLTLSLKRDDEVVKGFINELDELKSMLVNKLKTDKTFAKQVKCKASGVPEHFYKSDDEEQYPFQLTLKVRPDRKLNTYVDGRLQVNDDTLYQVRQLVSNQNDTLRPTKANLMEALGKGVRAKLQFKVESVWFVSGKCGLTLLLTHALYYKKVQTRVEGFGSQDLDDVTEAGLKADEEESKTEEVGTVVEESFDEDV